MLIFAKLHYIKYSEVNGDVISFVDIKSQTKALDKLIKSQGIIKTIRNHPLGTTSVNFGVNLSGR